MAKRILVSLLAAICILTAIAVLAFAQTGTKLRTLDVNWHTTLDPSTFPTAGIAYMRGDSFTVYRGTGIRNSAEQADTTQSIDLRQFVMPGTPYSTIVASDSVAWLRLSLYPIGTSPTVAADTASIAMQVSDDNVNWTSLVWTGPKISPILAAMGAAAALETGTSNNMPLVIRQVVGGATQSIFNYLGTGAPTANQAYGFKYARFICIGDYTGQYDAELTGFVPIPTGNTSP